MILKVVWRVLMGVLRVLEGCCRVFEVCLEGVWKNKIEVWNQSDPPLYEMISQKIFFFTIEGFPKGPYDDHGDYYHKMHLALQPTLKVLWYHSKLQSSQQLRLSTEEDWVIHKDSLLRYVKEFPSITISNTVKISFFLGLEQCSHLMIKSNANWNLEETQPAIWPRPKHQSSSHEITLSWSERMENSWVFLSSATASFTLAVSLSKSNSSWWSSREASTVVLLKVFRLPPFFTTVKPSKSISLGELSVTLGHLENAGLHWMMIIILSEGPSMRASITPKYGPFHVSMADIISLVLVHMCDIIFHIITPYPLFCHWSRASSSVNLLHDF